LQPKLRWWTAAVFATFMAATAQGMEAKPNVLFILTDNLGYGELGVYGGGATRGAPTPRIDRLAAEGLRLTNMNMEAQCTPNRSSLQTGRFSIRSGTYTVPFGGVPDGLTQYVVRFAPGQLPPTRSFWSLTMYDLPGQFLVANPLNRYLINSPMLPSLKSDADGRLTLHIQHESPGQDKESNWLPAPDGPFFMVMRIYWPKPEVLDGTWKQPPVERVK
jgi:hypothetical protein